jgi:hypothetical protein
MMSKNSEERASEDVDVERLKGLPNLTFMFQFDRGSLIRQYEYLKKTREGQRGTEVQLSD